MDGAKLMAFCAHEFEAFFSHIGGAIKQYQTTGQLPESLFKGVALQDFAAGDKKTKAKRKPTAFNMFVKDKMEEFKVAGVKLDDDKNGNLLFTLAVSEWKKLDEEAKQEYTRRFKANLGDADPSYDPDSMPADLDLDFNPSGLSAGLSPGLSLAALGQSPIDPGPFAAGPTPHSLPVEADVATKKRKMREAEQQPLLKAGESPLSQVPLNLAAVDPSDNKQKKRKDKQVAE